MRVIVGMSGGVDSSVAAYLLKKQGHEVIGLFMHNWEETDGSGACCAEADYEDVRRVCSAIGIPYFSVNYSRQYMDKVFSEFLKEYASGRTPNPDVLCNKEIKFGPFLEEAMKLGADKIATGHYCGIEEKNGLFYLKNSKDTNKDQTYFLNQLNQKQLSKVIFPLENIEKPEVRKIAEELELSTAKKKDSTGICFIGERKFRDFLKNYLPAKKGKIIDTKGNIVGEHEGLMYYTLGQRRGLNLGGRKDGNGERWFVLEKNLKDNTLIVSQGDDDLLYSDGLITKNVNWIPKNPTENEFLCSAKFRYRQPNQDVKVKIEKDFVKVHFMQKQRAVTPGQYVVFYKDGYCLGGGVIEQTFKNQNE